MNTKRIPFAVAAGAATALFLSACASPRAEEANASAGASAAAATPAAPVTASGPATVAALPTMTVYKSPSCGCCKNWIDHVKAAGFQVEVHDMDDVTPIKDEAGVPATARSCHTAIVGGYTIEGHVPAETIVRLLREQPKVAGLSVPGMPTGAPGMEMPGQPADRYDVLSYRADGSTSVFESH